MQKTQAYYYGGETNLRPTKKNPLVHACLAGIRQLSKTVPERSDKNYESTWITLFAALTREQPRSQIRKRFFYFSLITGRFADDLLSFLHFEHV